MFKIENKVNALTGYKTGTDKHEPEIIQSILTINGMRVCNSLRSNVRKKKTKHETQLGLRTKLLHKLCNERVPYNSKHTTSASGTKRPCQGLGNLRTWNPFEPSGISIALTQFSS